MYKKILVPLDGSDRAAAILPHVIDMAQCNQASVTLLQVIEREVVLVSPYDPLTSFEPENLIAQQITDAEAYLDAHCAHLQELGIAVQRLVVRGPGGSVLAAVRPGLAQRAVRDRVRRARGRGWAGRWRHGCLERALADLHAAVGDLPDGRPAARTARASRRPVCRHRIAGAPA